jgi:hypothetical protein
MKRKLTLAIILFLSSSLQSLAQGNLLITPMRIVFDGAKQNQLLNLVNTGTDTATYSISLVQFNMKEDGTFTKIGNPDEFPQSAKPFLRIYPLQITLAPGEPQVIMIQCRRKADMSAGEYRSHLYFRAEKKIVPLGLKKPVTDTTQLSIQLTPVFGLCIPIIIRTTDANVMTTLSGFKLESAPESPQYLKFTINRTGNISTYGDIIVDYIPAQGKQVEISKIRGVGVYTDIIKRNIVLKLNTTPGVLLGKGKLMVRYITNDDTKKSVIYADGELDI